MAPHADDPPAEEAAMIDADEGEEIPQDDDAAMDSGSDNDNAETEEIHLQNDSIAHFDAHTDSIFCIAKHPTQPSIVATGAGDDTGYVWSRIPQNPAQSGGSTGQPRDSLTPISKLQGHTDSITSIAFSRPDGRYVFTGGMDGQLRVHQTPEPASPNPQYTFLASAREVDEITFLHACPHPSHPHTLALGASDGSVWLYAVDASSPADPLVFLNAFYLHTAPATAAASSPDGALLATVSEDSSLYVWDCFGDAAANAIATPSGSSAVVALTASDDRFFVDGGLYSCAIAPNGSFVAVGGAAGCIRIVGLPRLAQTNPADATGGAKSGAGSKAKASGGRQAPGPKGATASPGQAGQILASLQHQTDSVETLSFTPASLFGLGTGTPGTAPLLAAGSIDGSIVVYDAGRNFGVRRRIEAAHGGDAVIQTEFGGGGGWVLVSCGNDGVVRRWDVRGAGGTGGAGSVVANAAGAGGSAAAVGTAGTAEGEARTQGCVGEWRGHRGGGEGGGVLGFVLDEAGRYVVTAGDDGVGLVFDVDAGSGVR